MTSRLLDLRAETSSSSGASPPVAPGPQAPALAPAWTRREDEGWWITLKPSLGRISRSSPERHPYPSWRVATVPHVLHKTYPCHGYQHKGTLLGCRINPAQGALGTHDRGESHTQRGRDDKLTERSSCGHHSSTPWPFLHHMHERRLVRPCHPDFSGAFLVGKDIPCRQEVKTIRSC